MINLTNWPVYHNEPLAVCQSPLIMSSQLYFYFRVVLKFYVIPVFNPIVPNTSKYERLRVTCLNEVCTLIIFDSDK